MNEQEHDVIIVGGGIAGSALATVLARKGLRVLVLERERQFRDRVRGEWLAPWGVEIADALKLRPVLRDAGAHPLPTLAGRSGKARPVQSPAGEVPLSFSHPRVQEAMIDAAAAAGAICVRGARVTSVRSGPHPRVAYSLDGHERTAHGRLIVGADGRQSLVRSALGSIPRVHRTARMLSGVRLGGLSGDPSIGYFVVRGDAGGLVSLFPQGDGYGRAYVFDPAAGESAFRGRDGLTRFLRASVALGVPGAVFEHAFAAGPLASFVADDSWVDHPAGGSLALIGDAAGISDPTWGMGMALALHDVGTLSRNLLTSADWDAALERYAADHDRYFGTIITGENWQSDLQLTAGADAERRRQHALRLWSLDPSRALDLPGRGPAIDVSAESRRRFFGEDVAMSEGDGSGDQAAGQGQAAA